MQPWSAAATLEKNKLATDAPFLILVDAYHKSIGESIRLVRNTEDIVWNGNTWTAFPLSLGSYNADGKTIPALSLNISNCGGMVQTYIQKYQGLTDAEVKIMVVHAAHLDNTKPECELDFIITKTQYDEQWISFTLGPSSEMVYRFPIHRFMNDFCPFTFKDIRCGYAGSETSCYNNLTSCKIPKRFGGEPGIQTGR